MSNNGQDKIKATSLYELIAEHLANMIISIHKVGYRRDWGMESTKDSENIVELDDGTKYQFWIDLKVKKLT